MKALVLCSTAITALLTVAAPAWAQPATAVNADDPNAGQPPMQAQELARLVPQDVSQPRAEDISKENARSYYRYDTAGVNCSLYPARCRGQNY